MKKITLPLILLLIASNLSLSGCFTAVAAGTATTVAVSHDRRSAGTVVDDRMLELRVLAKINEMLKNDPDSHLSAVAYNSSILLVGQASNDSFKHDVESAIRDIAGVGRIYNEITIDEVISPLVRSKDTWITTKVKGNMVLERYFDSTRVKVVTENGIVYLLGLVTQKEEDLAVDLARHVDGVKKVITLFEYIADSE